MRAASLLRSNLPDSRLLLCVGLVTFAMAGCASQKATVCDLDYCDDIEGIQDFRNRTAAISYPCIDNQTAEAVATSTEPRNLKRRVDDVQREISLSQALQMALSQNKVIETSALGGVGTKTVLQNPQVAASVYDPAIQASGILFGRRSVEAALADFDTNFTSSISYGRTDLAGGNLNGNGNRTNFTSSLQKQFATGGLISLNHDWTHTNDAIPYSGDGSTPNYFGRVGVAARQPLLAGSGVSYTRIAGPANPNFGAITGVSQGVVIARINQDISLADFEVAVRNALLSIENAYWDLYLAYRLYDTAVVAHQSTYQTWKESQDRLEVGVLKPADELQARDQLYETKAAVENSLNSLYRSEAELRRLIGLPMNDGTVLVPSDEPVVAEFSPDWNACVTDGMVHRVELRRQKWSIKSLQLQLQAAKTLVRPRLDVIGSYDVQGAGDRFIAGGSGGGLTNALGSLTHDNINTWNLGVELSMPLGFRFSRGQVRNIELQLAKANAVLASQEKNVAHDIATSIQDISASHESSKTNYKRLVAATKRAELLETEREVGTTTLDLVLRAQRSLALAEGEYYRNIVQYNKSIAALNLSTGRLLDYHNISLAEGGWCPEANCDALLRAHARTHAIDAPHLSTQPADFASNGPTGTVNLYGNGPALPFPIHDSSDSLTPSLADPVLDTNIILPPPESAVEGI